MLSNTKQSSTEVGEVTIFHSTGGFGPASGMFNPSTAYSRRWSPPRKIVHISSVLEMYLISRISCTWNEKLNKEKQGSAFLAYADSIQAQRESIYKSRSLPEPSTY